MGMLAFTAAELKIVQTLEHWGFNDHWDHYSQHGPILNVASLLYFLLLLPFDALSNVDRARLVWFVDMVPYYKYEAVRVLRNRATFTPMHEDYLMLGEAQQLQETNCTIRIERLQRPALRLLIQDVKAWFTGWQRLRSMKWVHISAAVCVRLRRSRSITHDPEACYLCAGWVDPQVTGATAVHRTDPSQPPAASVW